MAKSELPENMVIAEADISRVHPTWWSHFRYRRVTGSWHQAYPLFLQAAYNEIYDAWLAWQNARFRWQRSSSSACGGHHWLVVNVNSPSTYVDRSWATSLLLSSPQANRASRNENNNQLNSNISIVMVRFIKIQPRCGFIHDIFTLHSIC